VIIKWRVRWVRPSTRWLLSLAKLWPSLRITFYDNLQKYNQESKFSWAALAELFNAARTTGELRIPEAAILGSSTLEFKLCDPASVTLAGLPTLPMTPPFTTFPMGAADVTAAMAGGVEGAAAGAAEQLSVPAWQLSRATEVTDLFGKFQAGEVKNRPITRDYSLFWLTRQPVDEGFNSWKQQVFESTGMAEPGQFFAPSPSSEDAQLGRVNDDGVAILAALTLAVVLTGVGFVWLTSNRTTYF
jgi:hypothetical protein